MKLLIIRHGDPDYSIDSLTEKGRIEAELLKRRLVKQDIKDFYCSPLGRAKATAAPTLAAFGKEAEIACIRDRKQVEIGSMNFRAT